MPMTTEETQAGVTVVRLSGRIDTGGAHEIYAPMSIVSGSKRAVVIDLSAVDFLASMGLRTVLFAAKSIKSKGGVGTLVAPPGDVRAVILSAGIDQVIPTYATLDEALQAVTASA